MEGNGTARADGHRIVVGYDGSAGARRALATAASLAAGDTSVIVAVVTPTVLGVPEPFEAEEHGALLVEALDYLASRGVKATALNLTGSAEKELPRAAKVAKADLLIVGTHGRHGIARLALGSVSSGVAQSAECNVLVVP